MKLLAMIQRVIIELLKDKRTLSTYVFSTFISPYINVFYFNSDEDTTLTIGITTLYQLKLQILLKVTMLNLRILHQANILNLN